MESTRYYIDDVLLAYAPIGWDTDAIKFIRNTKYHGIFTEGAIGLEFVKDGADKLRAKYYGSGVEAESFLKIERLNKRSMEWEVVTTAKFDFTTFEDDFTTVKCEVVYTGVQADFKNNDKIKYTIPVGILHSLSFDGVSIENASSDSLSYDDYSDIGGLQPHTMNDNGALNPKFGQHSLMLNVVSQTDPFNVIQVNQTYATAGIINDSTDFFVANSRQEVTINIAASLLSFKLIDPQGDPFTELANMKVVAYVTDAALSIKQTVELWAFNSTITSQVNYANITGSETIMIDAGDRIHIFATIFLPNRVDNINKYVLWDTFDVQTSVRSQLPNVQLPVISAIDLFEALVANISSTATAESNYLSNLDDNNQIMFMGGSSIRGVAEPYIMISMEQFFNAINSVIPVEVSINGTIISLEQRQNAYLNDEVSLGACRNLVVKPANEMLFRTITVGCETQDYDIEDGNDEFNARQQWDTVLKSVDNDYNLLNSVRTDMYGIDRLRLEYYGTTKDDKDDNAVFMVDCEKIDVGVSLIKYYKLSRDKFSNISGLTNDFSAYNLWFSPKRCLIRHGAELRSMLKNYDSSYINLLNYDKNVNLQDTLNLTDIVSQQTSIQVSDLAQGYFMPVAFEFEVGQNFSIFATIKDNANKTMVFTYKGITLKGYIMDVSLTLAKRSIIKVRLLASYYNNLNSLI